MRFEPRYIIILFLLSAPMCAVKLYSQNVDLENALGDFREKFKKNKKIKITGGISANTTFSKSTTGGMRDPFMYSISGNLNFSFMSVNIPVSLNYTNAGFSYSYQFPRPPSRFSFHPKYKWVQAHFGDFSMNFSPYTMSGFQIKGVGVDLQPKGKWKYSAFYGQFQKAVPYIEGNGNTLATYKRVGSGLKVGYTGKINQSAISIIRINDISNSLVVKPDSLNIYPKGQYCFWFRKQI